MAREFEPVGWFKAVRAGSVSLLRYGVGVPAALAGLLWVGLKLEHLLINVSRRAGKYSHGRVISRFPPLPADKRIAQLPHSPVIYLLITPKNV